MQGDAGVHVCVPYAMQHMDVAFLLLVNSNGMQLQDHNLWKHLDVKGEFAFYNM